MRLRRRASTSATYAALVAQRHLWLVLDGPGTVGLQGADVPVEHDEQGGHHGLRLDLAGAGLGAGRHDVLVDGWPLAGPPVRPAPAGAATALERDEAGHLHVVRREVAHDVTLRTLRLTGEGVEIDLETPPGTTAVTLDDDGKAVARLALTGSTLLLTPADVAGAQPGAGPLHLLAQTPDGPRPVHRRANDLADPGNGALLPALHPDGEEHPVARLRWSPGATLVLRLLGEHA